MGRRNRTSRALSALGLVAAVLGATSCAGTPAAPRTLPAGVMAVGYNDGDTGPLPVRTRMHVVRLWDTRTTWCDVQPSAEVTGDALDRSIANAFGPYLDNAVDNEVARVVVVVGHPAPWVYGQDPATAPTSTRAIWYCPAADGAFYSSAVMMPSASAFASSVRPVFQTYARALMRFIGSRYHGAFQTDFQTANELNMSLLVDPTVPGTASTAAEAGAVLAEHDAVLRGLVDSEFAGNRFTVMASALASGTFAAGGVYRGGGQRGAATLAYLQALEAAPRPIVDSMALNSYSRGAALTEPGPLGQSQFDALTANWRDTASGLRDALAGRVSTRAPRGANRGFPRLAALPRVQTETNQNLVTDVTDCASACDLTNTYLTDDDRAALARAMVTDGRALGFDAQLVYRWNANAAQVALPVSPGSVSLAVLDAVAG